jgi:hypothetical protein
MTLGGLSIVSLQKCGGTNIKLPPGAREGRNYELQIRLQIWLRILTFFFFVENILKEKRMVAKK